jgi:hypothetical protein
MAAEVARQECGTDTVSGIQQQVETLAKEIESLHDSPRKQALRVALAEIRAITG